MQTVTNFYISNLALSDVILAVFCIPFQFRAALMQRWDLPEFMCQLCPFMQTLSVRSYVKSSSVMKRKQMYNCLQNNKNFFEGKTPSQ